MCLLHLIHNASRLLKKYFYEFLTAKKSLAAALSNNPQIFFECSKNNKRPVVLNVVMHSSDQKGI
jgi:hypothetical protein